MRTLIAALIATVSLTGCADRPAADDAAVHTAIAQHHAGAEVTFDGTVETMPQRAGDHEHLVVMTPQGDRLEVDHNVSLAPWVPARSGDQVIVHGQLYIDPGRAGVHCTHAHTSSGCPIPGWIELAGRYYE
jgi:hypothetical protein